MLKRRTKKVMLSVLITLSIVTGCAMYFSNKISFKTYEMSVCLAVDIKEPKVLYENSDAIFIGKIEKKLGQVIYDNFPETQFSVKVEKVIKGNLQESVVVNQEGGIKNYSFHIPKGVKLLEVGKVYFLAGKYDKEKNTYIIAPIYGDILINNDSEVEEYVKRFEIFKK